MPALLTRTSIVPNRPTAVSAIAAAVAGAPMSPSTRATLAAAKDAPELVMSRAFATTRYPRSRNALTQHAPMPCEAPVTMAVLSFAVTTSSRPYQQAASNVLVMPTAWEERTAFPFQTRIERILSWGAANDQRRFHCGAHPAANAQRPTRRRRGLI